MNYFRKKAKSKLNLSDMIMYSYDLQAGSYTKLLTNKKILDNRIKIGKTIANKIDELDANSVLEAGIGEGSSMKFVLENIKSKPKFLRFDISISRLLFAQNLLFKKNQKQFSFFYSRIIKYSIT